MKCVFFIYQYAWRKFGFIMDSYVYMLILSHMQATNVQSNIFFHIYYGGKYKLHIFPDVF